MDLTGTAEPEENQDEDASEAKNRRDDTAALDRGVHFRASSIRSRPDGPARYETRSSSLHQHRSGCLGIGFYEARSAAFGARSRGRCSAELRHH